MKMDVFAKHCVIAVTFFATVAFTACDDQNFDWEKAKRQNAEYNYAQRFESLFGNIDPNQTWDFSDGTQLAGTRAFDQNDSDKDGYGYEFVDGLDFGVTSKVGSYSTQLKYYPVVNTISKNKQLYNSVGDALPDGTQHTGKAVVLSAPGNSFTIYPFSAQGAYTYDLYIKIGDNAEIKVFSKTWSRYDQAYVNDSYTDVTTSGSRRIVSNQADMPGIKINAEVGTPIQIYIKNIKNGSNSVTNMNVGTGTSSAIYVTPSTTVKPAIATTGILKDDSEIKYVGIEDAGSESGSGNNKRWTVGGDKDFNDLVLVIIGYPKAPQELEVKNGSYTVKTEDAKRYMVEDMGYSDGGTEKNNGNDASEAVKKGYTDIDFNDIVVDFSTITTYKHETETKNGIITKDDIVETIAETTATVRALGGTWDFKLYVGDGDGYEVFHKSTAHTDSYNYLSIDHKVTFNENYPTFKKDPAFDASMMYNTGAEYSKNDGQYITKGDNAWLCKFKVNGWNSATHNIRFEIIDDGIVGKDYGQGIKNDLNSATDTKNVYTIGFPKVGATPKIVAFPISKEWQLEKHPVRREWFTAQ